MMETAQSMPGAKVATAAFYETLERHGDAVALVDEHGVRTSYRALDVAARAFAEQLGATPRLVFLEATNSVGSIAAYLGCLIGGHPVYLYQNQDDTVLGRLMDRYKPNVNVTTVDGAVALEWLHQAAVDLHPNLRVLLSTSGSTGSPKFVKLSGNNIDSNARSIAEYLEITPEDRAITGLKYNYSYGMSVINSSLAAGASLLLTERSVTEPEFWECFKQQGATSFAGVPYTFETLARMESLFAELPSLRYATQAGGRLGPDLIRRFARLSREQGWRFYVMYGQTEASPRIAYLPPDQSEAFPTAIGRAIPGGHIDIIDEDGVPITDQDRVGELLYSGPNVMMGYAEDQAGLASDDSLGHLRTGDLARWNSAGLVEIVGRASRFAKPFGLRINLDEVEAAVRRHAPSAACAGTDETIFLALTEEDGPLDEAAIIAELAAAYKLPAFVFKSLRVAALPRLPTGKIDYRAIVELGGRSASGGENPERSKAAKLETEIWLSRNQIATLLFSGLWHGAAWTFVSWGFFHGLMLVAQRQIGRRIKALYAHSAFLTAASIPLQIGLVFTLVAASRVLFRSQDFPTAIQMFKNILTGPYNWGGLDQKANIAIGLSLIVSVTAVEGLVEIGLWRRLFARRRVIRLASALLVFMLILLLGDFGGGRFIYVRF